MAENDHPPLTWHIALTTVYALTCYTVMFTEDGITVSIYIQIRPSKRVHPEGAQASRNPQGNRAPTLPEWDR